MNFRSLLLSVAFSIVMCVCARADDYIVKLGSEVELMDAQGGLAQLGMITADEQTAEKMLADGTAEYIVKDEEIELLGYNDTYYENQWAMQNHSIEQLKEKGLTGKGIRIAVIDTGVYAEHKDLEGATILDGWNYTNDSSDTSDLDGHGTSVTGIISAQENNARGIVGIAPKVEIVPLVVYQNGTGKTSMVLSAVIDAIDKYDCKILNMSLGTTGSSIKEAFQDAIDYAVGKGAIVVAATGNKGTETYYYPAGCDKVIGVGSADSTYTVAPTSERNDSVDFSASGVGIYTLSNSGNYRSASGTSFACPTVVAVTALLLQNNADMDYFGVMEVLKAGCMDVGDVGYDTSYGYGFINALASYEFMTESPEVFISPKINESDSLKIYSKAESLAVIMRFDGDDGIDKIYAKDVDTSDNLIYIEGSEKPYSVMLWDSLEKMNPVS